MLQVGSSQFCFSFLKCPADFIQHSILRLSQGMTLFFLLFVPSFWISATRLNDPAATLRGF